MWNYYRPTTNLQESNVSTPVCLSTGGGVYDVTPFLAAWSHVPSAGGLPLDGGLPLEENLPLEGVSIKGVCQECNSRKDQMVGSQWAYRTRMKSSKATYTPE